MCSKKTSDGSGGGGGGGGDKKFAVMIQTDHKDHYDHNRFYTMGWK